MVITSRKSVFGEGMRAGGGGADVEVGAGVEVEATEGPRPLVLWVPDRRAHIHVHLCHQTVH